jgi:DNA-binding transcriptional LysR family regulator
MADPRISLTQWRSLVAVVDRGGYAQAAAALHKSQSAVTYAIQQLERQLGVAVFKVAGRRAVLTPTGELLVRRARLLIDDAASLEQAAGRLSAGWEPEVRISADVIFPSWLLFDCFAALNAESPHTRVELSESVLGHRTDTLARGEAELAIFASVPPGFLGEALMRVRFILVTAADHPLQQLDRPVTLHDLGQHRQLVVRETSPDRATRPAVDTALRWTVSHMATSIEAVLAGHGFAYLPEHRIRDPLRDGRLRPLPVAAGGERYAELYLIHADRDRAGPATRRLGELIKAAVARECRDADA